LIGQINFGKYNGRKLFEKGFISVSLSVIIKILIIGMIYSDQKSRYKALAT
jgi:hypothetical protein